MPSFIKIHKTPKIYARNMDKLRTKQVQAFVLTWVAYASTYFLRKPLGVVKTDLESVYTLSKTDLGLLDTALLLPYAFMQILLGNLGDKYGARKALTVCLLGSALSMFSFGFWGKLWILFVLLFLNGTFQATAWPNCVKGLSDWYSNEAKSTIFGFWGTCTFAGGIMGTAFAVRLQSMYAPDLKNVFLFPSIFVAVVGVLVFLFLQTPAEVNIQVPGKESKVEEVLKENKQASVWQIFQIPMVSELCWTNFCVKLVRYCLYMWLPMFLFQYLQYSKAQAGMLSTVFEIGGVFGAALIGLFIDRVLGHRVLWGCCVVIFSSAVFLGLFIVTSKFGIFFNIFFMFLAGVCNCGPDPMLTGSVPAQIGERTNAQAGISGFVNGFGSVGSILEGIVIGFIAEQYGWAGSFYFMIALSLVGTFCLFRAARIDSHLKSTLPDAVPA